LSAPSSLRWLAIVGVAFLVAIGVSGALYARSRGADFRRHALAIEAFGAVRHADEVLSKQVLEARFGLLNQYDSLNKTELELTRSGEELRRGIEGVLGEALAPTKPLDRLDAAIAEQRQTVESFKAENSILRNSIYYLPTASREMGQALARLGRANASVEYVESVSQAALIYNLVGDESAREAYARALSQLEARSLDAQPNQVSELQALLAHARVIRDKQPAVDGWVRNALGGAVRDRLDEVELPYQERFDATVAASNRYRRILYGWSMLLAVAVGAASLQLRRLYADLESRVAERTAELGSALDALWGEMKLARKIQVALVPNSPTLTNCDVAASMRPAKEVGGDYYDVIAAGGSEWILIGDVSGHGVPAGLVMMMCHTSVRTVLRGDPDVSPGELLARVNTVLTENIRQLGEDKYVSITALRRDPDGTISFAGAHQDMHVYRSATNTVEAFETEGIWLGIMEPIGDSLRTRSFRMNAGDVLVVHTDGITEAMQDGVLFDNGGLRQVIGRSRGRTAQQIVEETFRALESFVVSDDATLLVIRQLDRAA
jgi:serine phosphatase RsbU (regulator of sigma subunit)